MREEMYRCNKCGEEGRYPKGSEVWCSCKPRVKNKMEKMKPELQRIMKAEHKLNLEYMVW